MGNVEKNELKIIFQKMRNGDESGIELLYKNYYSMIYGIAYSILKNKENSEDIVHNVFTKLMKMDKNLLPSKGESSWLYIVTKNEVMQFLRGQKVNVDIDDMYTIEAENNEIEDFIDMTSDFENMYYESHQVPHGFVTGKTAFGHLNADGHRVIAKSLYDVIVQMEEP